MVDVYTNIINQVTRLNEIAIKIERDNAEHPMFEVEGVCSNRHYRALQSFVQSLHPEELAVPACGSSVTAVRSERGGDQVNESAVPAVQSSMLIQACWGGRGV